MIRRLVLLSLFIFMIFGVTAQAPESFKYQAVLRDDKGKVIDGSQVGIQISILQGSQSGTAVYVESFTPTTNGFGLINLNIGTGSVTTGVFADIDWAVDSYFLRIGLDENGGTNYINIGATQLLSVPYALHAKTSADRFSGDYADLTGVPAFATVALSGDYDDLTNKPSLATVATTGDYNDLSNQPALATVATTGDFNDLNNIPSSLGGIPQHEWSGTSLRFENPDGSFGAFTDLQGPAGADGSDGVDGRSLLNGSVNPTTEGNDGDFYLNTATSTLFGPKSGGTWPAGVSIVGAQGPQGVAGPQGTQGVAGPQGPAGVAGPAGSQGPQGVAGPAGPQGPAGIDGLTIITGSVDPTSQGNDGDIYINTLNSTLFGPKASGTWPAGVSLIGADGLDGQDGLNGRTILSGLVDPTTQGDDGDFYINTAATTLFGPKSGGTWPAAIQLVGAQGPQGVQGPQGIQGVAGSQGPAGVAGPTGAQGPQGVAGPAGAQGPTGPQGIQGDPGPQGPAGADGTDGNDGRTIMTGAIDPTTEGTDGDMYINTATSTLFGPKAGGSWPTGVSLLNGPAGPQGPTGPQGPAGTPGPAGVDGQDGKTILSGAIDPTTEGVDGDFYLNTSTSTLFGPKSAGAWSGGVSLLNGPAGPQGPAGPAGPQGMAGSSPSHEWDGTSLRFENPDGSFGSYVDLQGPAGATGAAGQAPEHEWSGTQIRFRNPNGSWGSWIDLKGEKGDNELTSVTTFSICAKGKDKCNCGGGTLLSEIVVYGTSNDCEVTSDTGSCRVYGGSTGSPFYNSTPAVCCVCR